MRDQTEMKIYEEQINIPLLNEVISFVASTAKITGTQRTELSSRCMFYRYSADWLNAVQEKYGFLYLGEMLERYEERFSMPPADLRAIALALGYTKRLQTDDMFVGNQKAAFVQKVRRLAPQDLYLTGAMYLLTEGTSESTGFVAKLLDTTYTKTEEILFVLSLFPSFEDTFTTLRAQLLELFGKSRTVPVLGNTGLYDWLIVKLQPLLKTIKTKDMTLFKALCALPSSHVKEGDKNHSILLQSGYTPLDIAYLNAMEVQYQNAPKVLRSDSVVTEKIVVTLFNEALAAEDSFEPAIYEQLSSLFMRYRNFKIRCNGATGLDDALNHNLRIRNCDTFLWLTKHLALHHWLFRVFDILDANWDELAGTMEETKYRELFDEHLSKEMDGDEITDRIQRYNLLTGGDYLDWYFDTKWGGLFDMLVDKGVIDLWQAFLSSIDENGAVVKSSMLRRIKSYLYKLKSIQAFRFYDHFLPQYGFVGLEKYFSFEHYDKLTFSDGLAEQRSYNNKHLDLTVTRDFLGKDEQQTLLLWVEEYIFRKKTDSYLPFLAELLLHPELTQFFSHEHLRGFFDLVINQPNLLNYHEKRSLKDQYLTDEEKAAEVQAEEIAKQKEQQRKKKETEEQVQSSFQAVFDGSFRSMIKFMDRHKTYENQFAVSCCIVYDNLYQLVREKAYVLDRQESAQLLHICSELMSQENMCLLEAQNLISKIKEASEHVHQSDNNR